MDITLDDIQAAARRLRGRVLQTPLVQTESGVHLKLESLQRTGSFKIRGATNAVFAAHEQALQGGVSTISAGNHGLGLATAAAQRQVACTVYVPETAVPRKVAAMEAAGARVVARPNDVLGQYLADQDAADGSLFISPFAHPHVAAGQGTVGLELAQQLPEARTILVPVGGGGLSFGVSTAIRDLLPDAQVYGVTASKSPAVRSAWNTGRIEKVQPTSIADGLGAPIADAGVVAALKRRMAGLLVVDDDQIRNAMAWLALEAGVVAEPAGAAAVAAALAEGGLPGPIACVVSGRNVDPELLAGVVASASAGPG